MSKYLLVALQADKIAFKIQELQSKYEKLLEKYDITWVPNCFGGDITELTKERIEDHFIITPEDKNNFIHWEICYDEKDGFKFYKFGALDFRWITGKFSDEEAEMKRILSNELEQLIEDKEVFYVGTRTVMLLDDRDIEKLENVLKELNK